MYEDQLLQGGILSVVAVLTVNLFIAIWIAALIFFEPFRKAVGLVLVIIGALLCWTWILAIFGIPMIFMGSLLLFIKNRQREEILK